MARCSARVGSIFNECCHCHCQDLYCVVERCRWFLVIFHDCCSDIEICKGVLWSGTAHMFPYAQAHVHTRTHVFAFCSISLALDCFMTCRLEYDYLLYERTKCGINSRCDCCTAVSRHPPPWCFCSSWSLGFSLWLPGSLCSSCSVSGVAPNLRIQ